MALSGYHSEKNSHPVIRPLSCQIYKKHPLKAKKTGHVTVFNSFFFVFLCIREPLAVSARFILYRSDFPFATTDSGIGLRFRDYRFRYV